MEGDSKEEKNREIKRAKERETRERKGIVRGRSIKGEEEIE